MSIPYQPQNLTAEQADGIVALKWDASLSATSYSLQNSTDGVNFNSFGSPTLNSFIIRTFDNNIGQQSWYRVAAVNASGTSPYSSAVTVIPAPPSEMSLYELRLRAQQTADRVGSQFVTTTEWNAFIRIAMYELYDLLIGSYEDYFANVQVTIKTNGSQQNYPVPDGVTNYAGNVYDLSSTQQNAFDFLGAPGQNGGFSGPIGNANKGDIYQDVNGYQFTVTQNYNFSGGNPLQTNGTGTPPLPGGTLTLINNPGSGSSPFLEYFNVEIGTEGCAPAFYKLAGVDLAVNVSTVNPSWVTLKKFNFIDRNKYIYPNSTSTIYGVYNQAYRLMGQQIQFIPVPAGNQTLRLTYAPRLPAMLLDNDLTTIGFSGWLRYAIVRSAKYALDKEEGTDTSKLDAELLFLKTRIEQMASNRDEGAPDTISETRRDGVFGGVGWGNGMGGGNAGW